MTRSAPPIAVLRGVVARAHAATLRLDAWSLDPGDVAAVVGPAATGKTTLIDLLSGLRSPEAGTVRVFGLDPVADAVEVRSRLTAAHDDTALFDMPIGELLRGTARHYPDWDWDIAEGLLRRFELHPGRQSSSLDGTDGAHLRLLLALAPRPSLLLLDEPAAVLPPDQRAGLLAEVLDLALGPGRAVLLATRSLDLAEAIGARVTQLFAR